MKFGDQENNKKTNEIDGEGQIWTFYNELTDFKEKYKNLVDDDMAKMDEEE